MLKELVLHLDMDLLECVGLFDEEQKCVLLSMYREGGSIDIFVDKFREGSITSYSTGLAVHLHPKSCLTGEDVYILLDMVKSDDRLRNALSGNRLYGQICQLIH